MSQRPNIYGKASIKWETPTPTSAECNFEWKIHDAPEFPMAENGKHYLGAVLIGYHFDGVRTKGVKLLAEVPEKSQFGEISVETVKKWELVKQPSKQCSKNRWASVRFTP